MIGPSRPSLQTHSEHDDSDNDSDTSSECIGPLPGMIQDTKDVPNASQLFEERAQRQKDAILNKDKPKEEEKKEREEWMLVPPDANRALPLHMATKARTFNAKTNQAKHDLHGWTSVNGKVDPAVAAAQQVKEKKRKLDVSNVGLDNKTSEDIKAYNKIHRQESLVSAHLKKQAVKEEPKAAGEKNEYKPFKREDIIGNTKPMNVKKAVQNAQGLGSRFSSGNA